MKVLVNGCSHLAGSELHNDASVASTMSWPNYISHWTQLVNIAEPGTSNDSICRRTIEWLEKNFIDFVYVQWTIFPRIELQIPNHKLHQVDSPWFCIHSYNASNTVNLNNNGLLMHKIAKNIFLQQFDNDWFDNYNLSQIIVLQEYLKKRCIPYKFGFVEWTEILNSLPVQVELIDENNIVIPSWNHWCKSGQYNRLDGMHYELAAHTDFAQFINKELL